MKIMRHNINRTCVLHKRKDFFKTRKSTILLLYTLFTPTEMLKNIIKSQKCTQNK